MEKTDKTYKWIIICGALLALAVGQWPGMLIFLVVALVFHKQIKDFIS